MPNSKLSRNAEYVSNAQLSQASSPENRPLDSTKTRFNFVVPGTPPTYICPAAPIFDEYNAWGALAGASLALSQRESIYRGMLIFNGIDPNGNPVAKGQFIIFDVSGFNSQILAGNPFPGGSCSACHDAQHAGNVMFQSLQTDIGIGGTAGSSRAAPNLSIGAQI
jgi:hypothetical protein